ncbi:AAA family ATPase [Altererythrobacter sp. SALINAS58]|uniref:gluconokinase n=1 Tax=Alteripontixanthobacter muriae TaxID=2705546 RepID=UPI001575FD34|nr:gluconokinase, GntK/IdnK-type [Alteripontixanthobacter muriae]NTZ43341.1 AAA family ATPase [Alteripontixanthobacter muriae]
MASADNLPAEAIVVIGPSASGKSTLARVLAAYLRRPFIEGDEFHTSDNLRKLKAGIPLSDEDRGPFLDNIGHAMAQADWPVIVSCSALKPAHRERLRRFVDEIVFVWPEVPEDELERRTRQREGHFMSPTLLADQIRIFDPPAPPERFIRIDGTAPTADQVQTLVQQLKASS